MLEDKFYGCSPFSVKDIERLPLPDGLEFGGCITEFGRDSSGNIRGCTPNNCKVDNLIDFGNNNPDPEKKFKAYSHKQMCDPYGQCDQDFNRNAAWPDGKWPVGCTFPGCKAGEAVKSTAYLESVKDQCGTFDTNPELERGAYSWQYDDPSLVGTSGGLGGCRNSNIDYTVTLCGP